MSVTALLLNKQDEAGGSSEDAQLSEAEQAH